MKRLCEDCRDKRIKLVGSVVLVGATVTEAIATGIYSKSNILSEFPNWRDKVKNIPQIYFAEILRDAAKETPDILNIKVFDKAA